MDNGYQTLIQIKRQEEQKRRLKYKEDSKHRLKEIAKKKIQTTMIGALDSIEKFFAFLWQPDRNGRISEEGKIMKNKYEKAREEILDRGNNQIRNLNNEIDQYDIEWLRYNLTLPINRSKKDHD